MTEDLLKRAIAEAVSAVKSGDGGPFGSVLADKNGQVVSTAHNEVYKTNDPTAHPEVLAIRRATEQLGRRHLVGYSLYSSCRPCPMCICAAQWARLDKIYFAASQEEATETHSGFNDKLFYQLFQNEQNLGKILEQYPVSKQMAMEPFQAWMMQRH